MLFFHWKDDQGIVSRLIVRFRESSISISFLSVQTPLNQDLRNDDQGKKGL